MVKTYVLNLENLNTAEDAAKIEAFLMEQTGIEKIDIELSLRIVSIYYNESFGPLNQLLEAFSNLGYPAR